LFKKDFLRESKRRGRWGERRVFIGNQEGENPESPRQEEKKAWVFGGRNFGGEGTKKVGGFLGGRTARKKMLGFGENSGGESLLTGVESKVPRGSKKEKSRKEKKA